MVKECILAYLSLFPYRVGRKTVLLAATAGAGVLGLIRSMAWSYEAFLVFEFLDPVFASAIYPAGFVLSKVLSHL
jgi:hypothetical protein